jgi:5-methyltetrahydrofolate--homocysteine methyltransferase
MASFVGCRLENGESTVWFHPEKEVEIQDVYIRFDAKAHWFRRIAAIAKAAVDRWQGQVQVSMTDLGGALDVVSSFRPGEKLLLDLYDHPQEVKRVRDEVHKAWWKYYDAFNKILRPSNPGYTAWTPIFSEEPYYMLQCDFAYMIGPEMFDEFVKPELAATCRKLKNAFYHLDGVGQLPHLDSLLAIPELKGIQWIPGDGQPDLSHWPEVYRKIRRAGKLIQLFSSQYAGGLEIVDVLAEQLGSAKGIIAIAGADAKQEDEVRRLLKRHHAD